MIVELQVLPFPPGTDAVRYAHVEAAIAVIQASGFSYEVGPLGTSVEGEPDQLWPLIRAVHEATLISGADGGVPHSQIGNVGSHPAFARAGGRA